MKGVCVSLCVCVLGGGGIICTSKRLYYYTRAQFQINIVKLIKTRNRENRRHGNGRCARKLELACSPLALRHTYSEVTGQPVSGGGSAMRLNDKNIKRQIIISKRRMDIKLMGKHYQNLSPLDYIKSLTGRDF